MDTFKDLYQPYWGNSQGELPMVPAMDAAELTLTILQYTKHLADIAAGAQKSSDENAWALLQAQGELKARTEEVATLKAVLAKKSPTSEETLSPQLDRALQEAAEARNQLAHMEAELRDLRISREEHQSALRRLADGEAEIARLQEMLPKDKTPKRTISYDHLSNSSASESDESADNHRRRRRNKKKSRHLHIEPNAGGE